MEPKDYIVTKIEGEYAYLREENGNGEGHRRSFHAGISGTAGCHGAVLAPGRGGHGGYRMEVPASAAAADTGPGDGAADPGGGGPMAGIPGKRNGWGPAAAAAGPEGG